MMKKFCTECLPISIPKGCIFHPIGEKKKCPNCGKVVRARQIVVAVFIRGDYGRPDKRKDGRD